MKVPYISLQLHRGRGLTGGGRVSDLAGIVDFTPTILDAAGIDIPAGRQGSQNA